MEERTEQREAVVNDWAWPPRGDGQRLGPTAATPLADDDGPAGQRYERKGE